MWVLKFPLIFLSIFTLIPSNFAKSVKGYNEPCEVYDETSSCSSTIGLMCIDSGIKGYRCKCPNDSQFGTIYDSKRNICVGKVFNSCVRPTIPKPNNSNTNPNPNYINPNETLCVENAECNTSVYYLPICLCKKGFFETDDGTCAPVAKYDQPCNNDKLQCDSKYGLSCHPNGKCGCKDHTSNQFYDPLQEKCISYVGANCSLDESLCVENAECTKIQKFPHTIIPNSPRSIIFGSEEAPLKNQPFSSGPNRNPYLNQYGNGGSVTNGGSAFEAHIPAKCTCKSGYSPTSDGHCMKSYGSVCKMMERNSTEICSPDQYLECLDGHDGHFRCQCRNPLNERWDEDKKQCVSLIGKKCRYHQKSPMAYPLCENGGECSGGICECKRGTSLTPIGGCKLDYNEQCQPGECNVYTGLTCHGKTGTCLCLDSYLKYDERKKACVAEIGSPCGNVDLMGFNLNGRGLNLPYRFSGHNSQNLNREISAGNEIPFIGCEQGATCQPKVAGKKMVHTCVPIAIG